MSQTRRHFSPDQKAQIVRRHLGGKEPISNLADEFGLQPSQIHNWVKLVLDQAERAFQPGPGRPPRVEQAKDRKIEEIRCQFIFPADTEGNWVSIHFFHRGGESN